jgi:hypothetical protein
MSSSLTLAENLLSLALFKAAVSYEELLHSGFREVQNNVQYET